MSILFFVNFPPRFGYCVVNPQIGSTLTQFDIKCADWADTEGSLVSFAYYGSYMIFLF